MSQKITFTTQYNRTPSSITDVSVKKFIEPSMVKESLAYATDINTIYENYCRSGRIPLNGQQPIYDENFVKYDSLIEAQRVIADAGSYFNSLPAEVRAQYGNKLESFVQAVHSSDPFLEAKGIIAKKNLDKPEPSVTPSEPSVQPTVPSVEQTAPAAPATTASADVL